MRDDIDSEIFRRVAASGSGLIASPLSWATVVGLSPGWVQRGVIEGVCMTITEVTGRIACLMSAIIGSHRPR